MNSVSRVSSLFVLVWLMLVGAASADVIGNESKMFGRIEAIKDGMIAFRPGCETNVSVQTIRWNDDIRYVGFDPACKPYDVRPPSAGIVNCAGGKATVVYRAHLKTKEILEASDAGLDSGTVRLKQSDGKWIERPKSEVEMIVRSIRCDSQLIGSIADEECSEPPQWAVNWSETPVADNRIFTKGFAIHVVANASAPVTPEAVRFAFQGGISAWTSALMRHRAELPPELLAYVSSITATSASHKLLTPPQVVRVQCRGLAMAVVTVSTDPSEFVSPHVVAESQVEGRAVRINAGTFRFFSSFVPKPDDPPINLVNVMTHELGHSFGLLDRDVPEAESVMAGVQNELRTMKEPTAEDVRRFVAVLRQSISGSKPGEFSAVRCAGLRMRADP